MGRPPLLHHSPTTDGRAVKERTTWVFFPFSVTVLRNRFGDVTRCVNRRPSPRLAKCRVAGWTVVCVSRLRRESPRHEAPFQGRPTACTHAHTGHSSIVIVGPLVNGRNIPIAVIFVRARFFWTNGAALSRPRYLYRASLLENGNSLDTLGAPDTISAVFWLKTLFRRRAA